MDDDQILLTFVFLSDVDEDGTIGRESALVAAELPALMQLMYDLLAEAE